MENMDLFRNRIAAIDFESMSYSELWAMRQAVSASYWKHRDKDNHQETPKSTDLLFIIQKNTSCFA